MTSEQLRGLADEAFVQILAQRVMEKLLERQKQALVVYTGSNIGADPALEALGRLRLVYPNILKLSYDNTRTRTSQSVDRAQRVAQKSPLELFEELYETQNNQPMSQEQRDFAQRLIEQLREEDA